MSSRKVSIIDLFSGPGGLSEGFSRPELNGIFGPIVSVEMDPVACRTLKLRKLFHALKGDERKQYNKNRS